MKNLYAQMLRIRLAEERIAALYPEQEMRCPIHLSIGQEATAVGVCSALSPKDYVMSGHRSHAHYLAKGGDLKSMLAELYGKATGCCRGKGGSMHFIDLKAGFLGATPIVGSTIAIAVGAAFGTAMRGEKRVTAAFFGEAATEEGVFHEAVNFAALKKLPIVFVCENNLYSVYSPLSVRQPKSRDILKIVRGHGIESLSEDGNDVLAVAKLAERAVQKARKGGGPTFLELKTYRWREHCGAAYDNHIGYRAPEEFEYWKKLCPIVACEKRLLKSGALTARKVAALTAGFNKEIDAAVRFAKTSPFPKESRLLEQVYAPS